jgi:hypothetical protein
MRKFRNTGVHEKDIQPAKCRLNRFGYLLLRRNLAGIRRDDQYILMQLLPCILESCRISAGYRDPSSLFEELLCGLQSNSAGTAGDERTLSCEPVHGAT